MLFDRSAELIALSSIHMEAADAAKVQSLHRKLEDLRETTAPDRDQETRKQLLVVHSIATELAGDITRYRSFAEESEKPRSEIDKYCVYRLSKL